MKNQQRRLSPTTVAEWPEPLIFFPDLLRRWLAALPAAALVLTFHSSPASAQPGPQQHSPQFVPCPKTGQPLLPIPEIARDAVNHRLRGAITLSDEERLLWFKSGETIFCAPQYMRFFQGGARAHDRVSGPLPEPLPGPTLRARVGDTVELTFLNQINPKHFGQSIDRGERGLGCDQTSVYPANTGDKSPNCFRGSSTANIHFHGTHTSPDTTGDNVLLQIRPSLRNDKDQPVATEAMFKKEFKTFFGECESKLADKRGGSTQPLLWPTSWSQLPKRYRDKQKEWLIRYDKSAPYQGKIGLPEGSRLWPKNADVLEAGLWPQYYVGAYPYCFRLPEYKKAPPSADDPTALQMGQAPGTHWYHAHKHGSTAINVSNGMAGAFIIEGDYDDTLRAFYKDTPDHKNWGLKEQVLVIQELGVTPNLERGGGAVAMLSVNGRREPVLSMRPGEVQLWRIVNAASRSGVYLAEPNVVQWRQSAQDGVQFTRDAFAAQTKSDALTLAAGNRADLLVMAPMTTGDIPVMVTQTIVTSPEPEATTTLLTIRVQKARGGKDPAPPMPFPLQAEFPEQPPFLADILDKDIHVRREVVFNTEGGVANPTSRHVIDGKSFSETRFSQVMLQNTAEEWKIVNKTVSIAHPFHIHVNPFQIVEVFDPNDSKIYVFGKRTDGKSTDGSGKCIVDPEDPKTWQPCTALKGPFVWRDVFAIPAAKTVEGSKEPISGYFRMRSRFADYPGQFVLHCHILAHEDRGMMQLIEVAPNEPLLEHH